MFFGSGYFYFITIGLQIICVIHCLRRSRPNYWIWLIVFIPVVGCIAYLFTEVFTRRDIQKVQSGVGEVFNPSGKIKKLENNLRFSDTFNNRVALADACLAAGQTQKATDLYESSLTGNFTENEHVLIQLVIAYSQLKRYEELVTIAKKIRKLPQFVRSHAHVLYAMALEQTGHSEMAEAEFKTMKGRFANFEARYQYSCFLARAGRREEALQLLTEMLGEFAHLSPPEKRNNRRWFALAKDELKRIKNDAIAKV
jgi:hypothetical protein